MKKKKIELVNSRALRRIESGLKALAREVYDRALLDAWVQDNLAAMCSAGAYDRGMKDGRERGGQEMLEELRAMVRRP